MLCLPYAGFFLYLYAKYEPISIDFTVKTVIFSAYLLVWAQTIHKIAHWELFEIGLYCNIKICEKQIQVFRGEIYNFHIKYTLMFDVCAHFEFFGWHLIEHFF